MTKVVLSYYEHLKRELAGKINLELLAVGSEGEISRSLCQECGFDYLEYPNEPLSAKWEYGLNRCADYDPDAVITVGSDDIISQNLIEFYAGQIQDGLVFCGLKDGYFLDLMNKKLYWWVGYGDRVDYKRVGETIGMGRCLSRTLLDKLGFSIWKGLDINRGLDGAMTARLRELGLQFSEYYNCVLAQVEGRWLRIGHAGLSMADIGACAVDIKISENITPITRYLSRDASVLVPQPDPWEVLQRYFSGQNPIVDQLKELMLTTRKILHIQESQEFSLPPSSNILDALELSEGDQSFLEQVISVNSLQANQTFDKIIGHLLKTINTPNTQDFQQCIDMLKCSKHEDALKCLEKLVEQDSNYIFYYYLGECLSGLGKWKEAVDAYQKANNLNPKFVNSYAKCGDVFMKLGQWDNAKNQFYQALCALL
ncbi:tetratricopeptide repeat protein [Arthrospira platensis SPKY2]